MSAHIGGIRRNVIALLGGQVSRLAVQALYFVVLARMLEPASFGLLAVVLAVGALAAPFSALGLNTLMVRNVSRDEDLVNREWSRSVIYTTVGGFLISAILALAAPVFLPVALGAITIFVLLVADLIGLRLIDLSSALWHTLGKSRQLVAMPTVLNLLRLIAALVAWWFLDEVTLQTWALFYAAATLPLGVVMAWITFKRVGMTLSHLRSSREELRDGVLFSVSLSSQSAFNDIDKTLLANLQSATSAGVYSAAYRVVDMAYAPIRSVAASIYPRLFRAGGEGFQPALVLVRSVAPMVLAFGALGTALVYFLAPYTPLLLGDEYSASVEVIRLLSPLVLLRGISFLAADLLSAVGYHIFRTIVQLVLVAANIIMNIVLIPAYGISGAIISTLLCEALLATALWARIVHRTRKSQDIIERQL